MMALDKDRKYIFLFFFTAVIRRRLSKLTFFVGILKRFMILVSKAL